MLTWNHQSGEKHLDVSCVSAIHNDFLLAVTLFLASSASCPICSDHLSSQCLSRPLYPEVRFAIQRWERFLSLSSRGIVFKDRQTHHTVWSSSKCPDRVVTEFDRGFPKVWIMLPEITSHMGFQTRLDFSVCHLVPFRSTIPLLSIRSGCASLFIPSSSFGFGYKYLIAHEHQKHRIIHSQLSL